MSYLFVFRAQPDIDHMAPLAWKLLESGEEVHAIVSPGYDPGPDPRIALLRRYPRFRLTEVWPADDGGALARARGSLRGTLPWALAYVLRHRVRLVAVEWGYGFGEGFERPASAAGAKAALRSLVRSLRRAPKADQHQPRTSFLVAARLLGRRTACLPHGLSVKLDFATNTELLNGAGLDWSDRNRFDVYVLNTEHHRRIHLDHAKGDPAVMQTWGSLRWAPEWFAVNRALPAKAEWPEPADGRVRVLFMEPKWHNRVDREATIDLVARLQAMPSVSLAIKGHPRGRVGPDDPLRDDSRIDVGRLLDVSRLDSVALIAESDVVMDVGSSIGLEVLMQEKVLLNPTYLHELETLFDAVPGACVTAHGPDEVIDYLERHAAGHPFTPAPEAYAELMRRAVYGDRAEPFDVLGHYERNVRQLATTTRS